MRRIGIIGGGASGIVAAIAAARTNAQAEITILEHKESIGKKILATGNGRCNLTNRTLDVSCYRSEDSDFYIDLLQKFDTEDAIRFFSSFGVGNEMARNVWVSPLGSGGIGCRTS